MKELYNFTDEEIRKVLAKLLDYGMKITHISFEVHNIRHVMTINVSDVYGNTSSGEASVHRYATPNNRTINVNLSFTIW